MAGIDPNLLVVKPVSQLEEVNTLEGGKILYYNGGNELKVADAERLLSLVNAAEGFPATTSNTPPLVVIAGQRTKHEVFTYGTFTNWSGLTVSEAELQANRVFFYWDGITATKYLVSKPQPTQNIPLLSTLTFPVVAGTQFTFADANSDLGIYQVKAGEALTTGQTPETNPEKVVRIGGGNTDLEFDDNSTNPIANKRVAKLADIVGTPDDIEEIISDFSSISTQGFLNSSNNVNANSNYPTVRSVKNFDITSFKGVDYSLAQQTNSNSGVTLLGIKHNNSIVVLVGGSAVTGTVFTGYVDSETYKAISFQYKTTDTSNFIKTLKETISENLVSHKELVENVLDDFLTYEEEVIDWVEFSLATNPSAETDGAFINTSYDQYSNVNYANGTILLTDIPNIATAKYIRITSNDSGGGSGIMRLGEFKNTAPTAYVSLRSGGMAGSEYFEIKKNYTGFKYSRNKSDTTFKIEIGYIISVNKGRNVKEYIDSKKYKITEKTTVLVASSTSSPEDKAIADFVCTGVGDCQTIQNAINSITSGTVKLLKGEYFVDRLRLTEIEGVPNYAIAFPSDVQRTITLEGVSEPVRKLATASEVSETTAIFRMTQTFYNDLPIDKPFSILAGAYKSTSVGGVHYPALHVNVKNIGFRIPDNQKPIICIDGRYMSALSVYGIVAFATPSSSTELIPASVLKNSVVNCIGIKGVQGSNFGIGNKWERCFIWGFHTAYEISGEHFIGMDLGSRFNDYGFRFNAIPTIRGAYSHPMTLINCCDEANFNFPFFGNNPTRQPINLIDFNMEFKQDNFNKGGNFAKELTPGQWRGNVKFTSIDYNQALGNIINRKFWHNGHGEAMVTFNQAFKHHATTAEINTYTADKYTEIYNTTVNKKLIFNGINWLDYMGNIVI